MLPSGKQKPELFTIILLPAQKINLLCNTYQEFVLSALGVFPLSFFLLFTIM